MLRIFLFFFDFVTESHACSSSTRLFSAHMWYFALFSPITSRYPTTAIISATSELARPTAKPLRNNYCCWTTIGHFFFFLKRSPKFASNRITSQRFTTHGPWRHPLCVSRFVYSSKSFFFALNRGKKKNNYLLLSSGRRFIVSRAIHAVQT